MISRLLASAAVLGLVGAMTSGAALAQVANFNVTDVGTVTNPDQAAPSDQLVDQKWHFKLGLGAGVVPDYEGSDVYKPVALPYFRAQKGYQYGQLFGTKVTSNVIDDKGWRLGPTLQYIGKRGHVANNAVSDIENVDASLMLGLGGGYDFHVQQVPIPGSVLGFRVEAARDVLSGNDGWLVTPSVSYTGPINDRWNFLTRASMTWADDSYMNSYFGISNADVRHNGRLTAFNADAGIKDAAFAAGVGYEITQHWEISVLGQYKQLFGDAKRSPVTSDFGSKNQLFGGVLLTYGW